MTTKMTTAGAKPAGGEEPGAAAPPPSRRRPRVVAVEGNIGCGKSTALAALAARGVRVVPEPLAQWAGLLEKFYADPGRWALALSLRVLLSFHEARPGDSGGDDPGSGEDSGGECPPAVVVYERSPLACRHVFTQLMLNDGRLGADDWDLFKEYWELLAWTPDVIAYVHVPHDECLERVRRRGRAPEAAVNAEYLRKLEFQYETMLRYAGVPVVRIDGTLSPDRVADAIAEVAAG